MLKNACVFSLCTGRPRGEGSLASAHQHNCYDLNRILSYRERIIISKERWNCILSMVKEWMWAWALQVRLTARMVSNHPLCNFLPTSLFVVMNSYGYVFLCIALFSSWETVFISRGRFTQSSVGSDEGSLLPFMMVWHIVSDPHKVMTALFVMLPSDCCGDFLQFHRYAPILYIVMSESGIWCQGSVWWDDDNLVQIDCWVCHETQDLIP